MQQLSLFEGLQQAYLGAEALSQVQLYAQLQAAGHVSAADLQVRRPVGRAGQPVSTTKRRIRWHQQTLRALGIIERVDGRRGVWRVTEKGRRSELTPAPPRVSMLAFDTDLGAAIWGACETVFGRLTDSVAVCITSPPYPIASPRAYGGPTPGQWIDFICRALEPIVRRLLPGGTIAVNLGNDVFAPGSPARTSYRERFVVAMEDRFGLHKLDEVIWHNPARPPGPIQWASRRRVQLNAAYEPVYVFCNDPLACFADNRRVLVPHSERHRALIERGGERRRQTSGDGAHRVRPGSYGAATPGAIPRNVVSIRHNCPDQQAMRRAARAAGLPDHGAAMPLALARFLVEWLSRPGDLVVDPMAGTLTTAKAAELTGRRWLATELHLEYLLAGACRFDGPSEAARASGDQTSSLGQRA